MFGLLKWAAPVAALGLMLGFAGTRAIAQDASPDKKETGSVSGVVQDKDGKPAEGVNIKLFKPFDKGGRKAEKQARNALGDKHGKAEKLAEGDKPAGEKPAKGDRPQPVSTAVTDHDGKFEMKDVPVGKYIVAATLRRQGGARQPVEIKSGENATVELKLEEKKHDAAAHAQPSEPEKKPADAEKKAGEENKK
jgi:5-hydroxyisourate hydrolase-like protein (transthyretin family)